MSSSHSKDPQQPSLWKSMVNKLLGPDTAAPIKPISDPNDLDGLDLDLLPPEPAAKAPAAPPATKSSGSKLDALTFDEPAPTKGDEPEPAEVFFSDEEDAVDEDLAPPSAAAVEEPVPARDDNYWDALSALDVGEEADAAAPDRGGRGGGRGGRGGSGGRGGRSGGDRGGRSDSRGGRGRSESRSRGDGESRDRGEGESRSRADRPERGGESERRRPASRPAPVAEELFADDDFGVGLVEESRAQIAALESDVESVDEELDVISPEAPGEGDESSEPRKRRRRRGRRGRGRSRTESVGAETANDDSETPASVSPQDVLFGDGDEAEEPAAPSPAPRSRREEPAPKRAPRPPRKPAVTFDESDEVEEVDEVDEVEDPVAAVDRDEVDEEAEADRPRRRRPQRGERSRSRSEGERSRSAGAGGRARQQTRDVPEETEEEAAAIEQNKDKYRNVPTWEEAISYLVQPKRRSSDSRGSRSRGSRGDSRSSRGESRSSRPRSAD